MTENDFPMTSGENSQFWKVESSIEVSNW